MHGLHEYYLFFSFLFILTIILNSGLHFYAKAKEIRNNGITEIIKVMYHN